MKNQEAIDLIVAQTAAGKTKEEITAELMAVDKIGVNKPTAEIIEALFGSAFPDDGGATQTDDDAPSSSAPDPVPPATPTPEPAPSPDKAPPAAPARPGGSCNYVKCKAYLDKNGKITDTKKIKEVNITDELADLLNRASSTGHGYAIRYIKK